MKLKVKPSLRVKKRYLLFEGSRAGVEKAVKEYLGVLGWARASPVFVGKNIVAVNRKEVENVRAAFELSSENIKVKKVSGTLKGVAK